MNKKQRFIEKYISSYNPADGSQVDANANISKKNIATMQSEIFKEDMKQLNETIIYDNTKELFNEELANEYIYQLHNNLVYKHDSTSLSPYCASVSLYPFLLDGLQPLGGESKAPKHLDSFCGNFINLLFSLSSQFAGAIATVEMLLYFDYFARKDYGDNYLETHYKVVLDKFEQVIYSINQPVPAKGYQSLFWNISLYDKYFFESVFGSHFRFPDMTTPNWNTFNELQKRFLIWFQKERERSILTFPVITMAMVTENGKNKDEEFEDFVAERMVDGDDFFVYQGAPTSLSSCCRLQNEIDEMNEFSTTSGVGGIQTGSLSVMSLNLPLFAKLCRDNNEDIFSKIGTQVEKMQKWQVAYKKHLVNMYEHGMLPVYDAHYITLERQYLTIGLIGLPEAYMTYFDTDKYNTEEYRQWCIKLFTIIKEKNKDAKNKFGHKFNAEMVPGENLGVKFQEYDVAINGMKDYKTYSSYFYRPEDETIDILDKFDMHGTLGSMLDGGQALHLNLNEPIMSKEQALIYLRLAAKKELKYWCWNVMRSICKNEKCGKIFKRRYEKCPFCGSNVDYATRIIGYLKKLDNFSLERRKEATTRYYHI